MLELPRLTARIPPVAQKSKEKSEVQGCNVCNCRDNMRPIGLATLKLDSHISELLRTHLGLRERAEKA